jgi:hypothetical protein
MDLSVKHLRDLFGGNIPVAQVLQSVASGMADCGVNVVIDPNTQTPYAIPEEKKIVLPAHVRSEQALLIVSWHVDHEAGHIIHSAPYKPLCVAWMRKSKMLDVCIKQGYEAYTINFDGTKVKTELPESILHAAKFFHNVCEDARIEHLMISRWPGTKKHFIGGPIAASCDNLVEDTLKEAKEMMEKQGLKQVPISPFFIAMFHASALMDGYHGQKERDYVRELAPDHVSWVMDLVDDEFGSVHPLTVTFEELTDKVDTVVANILDKILPEHQEQPEGGGQGEGKEGGEGQPQPGKGQQGGPTAPNPFDDKIDPDGEAKGKPQPSGEGEEEDGDEGEGSDSSSGFGNEDESGGDEGDSGGSESSEEGESEGDSSDDNGDESGGDDSSSGDDDRDADESGGDVEPGSSDDDSDGDGDSDNEGEEDESDRSEPGDGSDFDEDQESSSDDSEGVDDSNENEATTGEINIKALPKQVEEWAKDAHVDTSELIRASGETGSDSRGAGPGDSTGNTSGAPTSMDHATDIEGMPDNYLDKLAPGARVLVIQDNDLSLLFNDQDKTFQAYDNFIRGLMPQNLGPAARKLLGRFKGAPGQAWSGNRINPKMLQPIMSGNAYGRRLYLRRNEPIQSRRGVCVMVAIDCSGSMCESVPGLNLKGGRNSKFSVSHAAARGIARLLQTVNVPFSVMGFMAVSMKYGSRTWSASRYCDIVNFLFKDFHEPWTCCEQRMLAMNPNTSVTYKGAHISPHTNSDGESLLWGATQIITREEDTKIMIVISDGLPYAGDTHLQSQFLKWAVRRIEIAGIKIGGLGLGDDGVKHYYRLHELIPSFPPGMGTDLTAPLYIQEKILSLVDRLTMEKQD